MKGGNLPDVTLLTNLEVLHLTRTMITDRDLACLKPLRKLRTLSVNDVAISDAGVETLADLNLKALGLIGTKVKGKTFSKGGFTHLKILDLADTKTNDEGLRAIATLDSLCLLRLEYCRLVTDEGVMHLSESQFLRDFFVEGTRVSREGARKLNQSRGRFEPVFIHGQDWHEPSDAKFVDLFSDTTEPILHERASRVRLFDAHPFNFWNISKEIPES